MEFQFEHSGAHPAIQWAIGPNRLEALLKDFVDVVSYEDMHALQGNRYFLIKECEGLAQSKKWLTSTEFVYEGEYPATFRILEFADKSTAYVFRDVDMNGRKFKTYVVVESHECRDAHAAVP